LYTITKQTLIYFTMTYVLPLKQKPYKNAILKEIVNLRLMNIINAITATPIILRVVMC
jgi:hypothetical protein